MTYVVRGNVSSSKIHGTSRTLDGAMRIATRAFVEFCNSRQIPVGGSGGKHMPDIREIQRKGNYDHWRYFPTSNTWRLFFPLLRAEFEGLNLSVTYFTDESIHLSTEYIDWALEHVHIETGLTDCLECETNIAGPGWFDLKDWPERHSVLETFFWRVYTSCPRFRKMHFGTSRRVKF